MSFDASRTILIALPAMTSAQVQARIAAGRLPAIAALTRQGVTAQVASPIDPGSIAAWGTIATGQPPERHGLLSRNEIWAGGLRPATSASLQVPPFWEWLADGGVRTIGVGWPASAPGAAWRGLHADDRLGQANGLGWSDWPVPRDVAPPSIREVLREVRVHPADLDGAMLRPFVPALAAVDQTRDHRLVEIALAVARFSTDFAAIASLLERGDWHLASFFTPLLADMAARFDDAPAPFDSVVDAAWTMVDGAIAALAARVRPGGTLILLSPGRNGEAGILLAVGPGLPAGSRAPTASLLDVAPTLLARYGLRADDLPGTARLGTPARLRTLHSRFMPAPKVAAAGPDLERVAAVGLTSPRASPIASADLLIDRARATLIVAPEVARALADQALAIAPDHIPAIGMVAAARAASGAFDTLAELADRIEALSPEHLWAALIRAGWHADRGEAGAAGRLLRRVEVEGGPDEWMRGAGLWLMLDRPADAHRLFLKVLERRPDSVDALVGAAATASQRSFRVQQMIDRARLLDPGNPLAEQLTANQ